MANEAVTAQWRRTLWESWHPTALLIAFLCAHAGIWTLYAVLTNSGAVHGDMLEAYSWGREFQLGYYKHPPFWAWIAGAWFELFPRTNWAFYLLATLNSGLAIIGAWQLIGLLARDIDRFNATALLLLLPAYTLQGHQYNANFILVSLWTWTVYFFVLSMERRTISAAAAFGILAAASMLSKYYSLLLLFSCFAASFLHPEWRRYYRSAAPYLSIAVCLAALAPHIWWITQNDFSTLRYAASKRDFPSVKVYENVVTFAVGCAALNAAIWLVIAMARLSGGGRSPLAQGYGRFVGMLALGPFLLTLSSALLGHFRISTNFASPIFFLMPLLSMQIVRPPPLLLRRLTLAAVGLLCAAALLLAPSIREIDGILTHAAPKPTLAVVHEAKRIWSQATGRPLRIVGGSKPYAQAAAFYSGDRTAAFAGFDRTHSPWITDEAIAREGLLAICRADDHSCLAWAAQIAGARQEIELTVPAQTPASAQFRLFVFPPLNRR